MDNPAICKHHYIAKEDDPNKELDRIDSTFQWPDLTLRVGNRKLYITQAEFVRISEVFEKMLSDNFREKKNAEINFTGKDYKTFVLFLRIAHPGLQDPFDEETVHQVLPLIDEYLAESARKRADIFLANSIKEKLGTLTSQELVRNINEAEQYNLPMFLKINKHAASKKLFKHLSSDPGFNTISLETRYEISIARWKETDKGIVAAHKKKDLNELKALRDLGIFMYDFVSKD